MLGHFVSWLRAPVRHRLMACSHVDALIPSHCPKRRSQEMLIWLCVVHTGHRPHLGRGRGVVLDSLHFRASPERLLPVQVTGTKKELPTIIAQTRAVPTHSGVADPRKVSRT